MAYNTINNLNNVYNFYMTTYAPKSSTPYDTHKKSELRHVYNSIVKMNKEAPLFILDTSKDSQQFAVGIRRTPESFVIPLLLSAVWTRMSF